VEQRLRLFLEEPLAVVLGRKPFGEPRGQASGLPAVEMENRALRHIVADTVPVERRLAADMQPFEAPLPER
jgi:hypothetical protein